MPPKKFNKPVKDSILIAKSSRYSVETNEQQRFRCIMVIIMQIILFCLYIGLEVVFLSKGCIEVEFVVLTLITVVLIAIVKTVQINSLVYIKQEILRVSTNIEIFLGVLVVIFTVLQFLINKTNKINWEVTILPCAIILGIYFVTACFTIYLTQKYIIEYMAYQQNLGMRKALISQASFEENLRKSMVSRRSAENATHFSIADKSENDKSQDKLPYEDTQNE